MERAKEQPRKIFNRPTNVVYIKRDATERWTDFSLTEDLETSKKQAYAIERYGWFAKVVDVEGNVVFETEVAKKPKRKFVSETEINNRWVEFAGAVLRLAKKDYIKALSGRYDCEKNVGRLERFFRSDIGRTLALGKQEYIIERCKKIAREGGVDNEAEV